MAIDASSFLRAMIGPPFVRSVAVRLRAPVAGWMRRPNPQAIVIYLAVRMVGVAVLALMAAQHNLPLLERLTAWDGQWYTDIADHGYSGITERVDANGQLLPHAPFAFFPLYPFVVSLLSGVPGASTAAAALTLSLGAGIAAACALVRIGRMFYPTSRLGLILVALWPERQWASPCRWHTRRRCSPLSQRGRSSVC